MVELIPLVAIVSLFVVLPGMAMYFADRKRRWQHEQQTAKPNGTTAELHLPVWALDLGVPQVTTCSGGRYMVGGDGDAADRQLLRLRVRRQPGVGTGERGSDDERRQFVRHDRSAAPSCRRQRFVQNHSVPIDDRRRSEPR